MKLLAFDTSASACSVALSNNEKITALHKIAPMQQANLILTMIQEVLTQAGLTLAEIDMLAYGCGPGSFTGIRLASAVAQGLGFAYSLPIMPISSLAAMAQAAFEEQRWSPLLVAVDARMGDIYWAIYANKIGTNYVELVGLEHLYKPESVAMSRELLSNSTKCYAIGDGWKQYQSQIIAALGLEPSAFALEQQPAAQAILTLAQVKLNQGESGVRASEAVPVYLR